MAARCLILTGLLLAIALTSYAKNLDNMYTKDVYNLRNNIVNSNVDIENTEKYEKPRKEQPFASNSPLDGRYYPSDADQFSGYYNPNHNSKARDRFSNDHQHPEPHPHPTHWWLPGIKHKYVNHGVYEPESYQDYSNYYDISRLLESFNPFSNDDENKNEQKTEGKEKEKEKESYDEVLKVPVHVYIQICDKPTPAASEQSSSSSSIGVINIGRSTPKIDGNFKGKNKDANYEDYYNSAPDYDSYNKFNRDIQERNYSKDMSYDVGHTRRNLDVK